MSRLMEIRKVCKSYARGGVFGDREDFRVLKEVDLDIEEGSCVGLLGKSGCGKSTLGRLILGLERPDSGQVLFRGEPIGSPDRRRRGEFRRNAQVVFQNGLGSVNPRMRAADIVAEPLRNFLREPEAGRRDRVAGLLRRVGLSPDDGKKLPHQFSGGELQRVCIARAIALDPQLIVLDEAVSSLDMIVQTRIIELLGELKRESKVAYLFISHDIRVLMKLSDELAVMNGGRIVAMLRKPEDIRLESDPFIRELLSAVLPPSPAERVSAKAADRR